MSDALEGGMTVDLFRELGIRRYINAHDTYTVYGGSRMTERTLDAMRSAAESFVDFTELEKAAGERIAVLTRNEGAFVTNGAAGALQLAAAVCICRDDEYAYRQLPWDATGCRDFVIQHCQHNAYDKAIEGAGGRIVEIGDADETLPSELEGVLKRGAAGVFFFASSLFARGSLPLEEVIDIARRYNTPVIVDAAAQLPPRENLWRFTEAGADMVLFSGGKTLCGPQDSGLILGKKYWTDLCLRFGAPEHGICRSSKTSREAVAGLWAALEAYMETDPVKERAELEHRNTAMAEKLSANTRCKCRIVPYGPVGQDYPRLFIDLDEKLDARELERKMRDAGIYIGREGTQVLYISPLNLTDKEAGIVAETLNRLIAEG